MTIGVLWFYVIWPVSFLIGGYMCFRLIKEWVVSSRRARAVYTEPRDGFERTCERLIDRAGRQKVFDRARALGWSYENNPPINVWAQIAHDIIMEELKPVDR